MKLLLIGWYNWSSNGVSCKSEKDLESSMENICSCLSSDQESINIKWHDINLLNRGQHWKYDSVVLDDGDVASP